MTLTERKSTFYPKHWTEIAKLLAQLDAPDQVVQVLCNKFGEFFEKDNMKFDFRKFQSYLTRQREGK